MHQRVGSGTIRLNLSSPVRNDSTPSRRASPPTINVRVVRKTSYGLPIAWARSKVTRNGPRKVLYAVFLTTLGLLLYVVVSPRHFERTLNQAASDVPSVSRGVIEKLRLLELHFGADQSALDYQKQVEYDQASSSRQDDSAAPAVADIPVARRPDPLGPPIKSRVPAATLDKMVCDGPCSFLIPAWLGEQETKAQQHLYQLGLLAMAMNRTLVLPNVQKSRMAACQTLPFSFYYADDSLARFGIPTISQAGFLEWAERRDPPATAQVVSIVNANVDHLDGALEVDSSSEASLVPGKPQRKLCLTPPKGRLSFTPHSPLAIFPPAGYHKNAESRRLFGQALVDTLTSEDVAVRSSRSVDEASRATQPDVFALNYELRYSILSPAALQLMDENLVALPFEHFEYAETWTKLAQAIASSLGPFVAVHWRTESLEPSQMQPCAAALLRRLAAVRIDSPQIRTVFLATDYPLEDAGKPHSGTFRQISSQHHAAFRTFLNSFDKSLPSMRLTTLAIEAKDLELPSDLSASLANFTRPLEGQQQGTTTSTSTTTRVELDLAEFDTGLLGIIDKSIAMTAPLFLSGYAPDDGVGSCAKISSFTKQIVDYRQAKMDGSSDAQAEGEQGMEKTTTTSGLLNVVGHFSQRNKFDD